MMTDCLLPKTVTVPAERTHFHSVASYFPSSTLTDNLHHR